MFSRAERRHHIERLKEARKHYWGYGNPRAIGPDKMTPKQLGKVIQHPQMCSCSGCGNQRRHSWFKSERRTLQERSQIEAEKTYEYLDQNISCDDAN
jgi:hypothetical protein